MSNVKKSSRLLELEAKGSGIYDYLWHKLFDMQFEISVMRQMVYDAKRKEPPVDAGFESPVEMELFAFMSTVSHALSDLESAKWHIKELLKSKGDNK